jgi:uncharacterized protein YukE
MLYQGNIETPDSEGAKETQLKNALNFLNVKNFGETISGPLTNALKTVITIDEKFAQVVSKMGRGMEYTAGIKKNLAEGAFEVVKLGGSIESAAKLQEAFLEATGKNVLLSSEAYKGLFAVQQTTGVAADALLNSLENVGMSIKDSSDLMYGVVETSQKLGVNAKAVSSLVASNLSMLNRFGFENGVEGLTRMAAKASALRINMETVTNLADGLLDPEKSIEFASALSRLGAVSSDLLDPLRLMNLAQNDVGELQNQLGEMFKSYVSFDDKTKKFELFPQGRMMLKEFSKELNIPIDQIEKMAFGTAKLDRALQEIDFGDFGSKLDEDTQEAIANMAQMNAEGKYEIVTKSGDKQNIEDFLRSFNGSSEELSKYVSELQSEQGKSPEEKLVDLATQQLGKTNEMVAALNQYKLSTGLALSRRENIDKTLGEQKDLINNFYGGRAKRYGPGGEFDEKGGLYSKVDFDSLMDPVGTGAVVFDTATKEFENSVIDFTKAVKDISTRTYDTKKAGFKGEDVIKTPQGDIELLPQDTIISLTQGPEFLNNLKNISNIIEMSANNVNPKQFSDTSNQFNSLNETLRQITERNSQPVTLTEKNETIERLISQNFSEKEKIENNTELLNLNQFTPILQNFTRDINLAFETLKPETISKPKVEERVENRAPVVGQTQNTTQEVKGSVNINLTVDVKGDNRQINEIFNDPLFVQKFKQKLDNIDFGFANTSQTSSLYNTQMIA